MALAATTVWELQADGIASDSNGGGFVAGTGTDYTQGAGQKVIKFLAAGGTYTNDLASTSASGWLELTSAAYNADAADGFCAADVGNLIHITSGTNFLAGWYEIKSVAGNVATLDRACGETANASAGSGYLGGPLLTIGGLGLILSTAAQSVSGMKGYIKGGTYPLANTTVNTAGGPLDLDETQQDAKSFILKGYATDAANRDAWTGTRPVIDCNDQAPTNVIELKGGSDELHILAFVDILGDAGTSRAINGIAGNNPTYDEAINCIVRDCDGTFAFSNVKTVGCYANSCAANGFVSCQDYGCIANACEIGFSATQARHCIAYNCTGDGFSGIVSTIVSNCVSYNSGGDGFDESADRAGVFINCLSYSDGGYSFNTCKESVLINCASDGASSGRTNVAPMTDWNPVTITGDPFTDASALDFSLDDTTAEGKACRAAGFDTYGQTGYIDIGAVQHADPAGGGGGGLLRNPGMSGGIDG